MNGSKGGQKTTENTKSNSVVTPIIPDDVKAGLGLLGDKTIGLLGQQPTDFRAGWNPFQDEAASRAAALGQSNPFADRASSILDLIGNYQTPMIKADNVVGDIQKYMDPYTQQVVDTTLTGFDKAAAQAQGKLELKQNLGGGAAFGGSGSAMERGTLGANLVDNRAATEAGLRSAGFTGARDTAMSAASSNQQAQLAKQQQGLQIAQMFAAMGNDHANNARADIGALTGVGNNLYGVQSNTAGAPIDVLEQLQRIYGGIANPQIGQNIDTTGTTTTKQSGGGAGGILSGLGTLAQGAAAIAPFFSDERLKRNVVKIAERQDGLGVYLFRYLWDDVQRLGLMAQEVLTVKPEAVLKHPSGYLMVDYARV